MKILLAVTCLGIGWSVAIHGSTLTGKALLSTHPQQRIFSLLNFSYTGAFGINRTNFSYQIGGKLGVRSSDKLLSLQVFIIKHDDGTYSVTDGTHSVTEGSYVPNEDESIAVLEWREDNSLVNIKLFFTKKDTADTGGKYPKQKHITSIEIEGTITPADDKQIITFSDRLTELLRYH